MSVYVCVGLWLISVALPVDIQIPHLFNQRISMNFQHASGYRLIPPTLLKRSQYILTLKHMACLV